MKFKKKKKRDLNEQKEIVNFLISSKCSVDQKNSDGGNLPIHLAVESNNLECLKILIEEKESDINATNFLNHSVYHLSILHNSREFVDYLCERDINFLIYLDRDPLLLLFLSGNKNLDFYQYLLEKKASVSVKLVNSICSQEETEFDLKLLSLFLECKSVIPKDENCDFFFDFF